MLTRAHWTQIPQSLAITEERDWPFSAFLTVMGDLHHLGQATEKPLRAHSNPIAPPHPPRQRLPSNGPIKTAPKKSRAHPRFVHGAALIGSYRLTLFSFTEADFSPATVQLPKLETWTALQSAYSLQ